MGVFNGLKKALTSKKPASKDWNRLSKPDEVEAVLKASEAKPQLVYKHSHTCGTCLFAKGELEAKFEKLQQKADLFFVNVKQARPVSDGFAEMLQVCHESPQVLIIKEGEAIWHASHSAIKADKALEVLGI